MLEIAVLEMEKVDKERCFRSLAIIAIKAPGGKQGGKRGQINRP